jgi:anti-sigma factor RsiW
MSKCQDLEPLFTSYVDGEAPPSDRETVVAHLDRCPPCRTRVEGERATRDMLVERRDRLRPCASGELRARCAAQASVARARSLAGRRAWVPLSLAATLLLATGLLIFGLNGSTALAAQLALDHMKCFQWGADRVAASAETAAGEWEKDYGWPLRVPAGSPENDLELLCVRRCFMTDGRAAHIMYKWRGEPLSVYVLPVAGRARDEVVDRLGHEAVIWTRDGRTYAVLAPGRPRDIEPLVRYVRANAR